MTTQSKTMRGTHAPAGARAPRTTEPQRPTSSRLASSAPQTTDPIVAVESAPLPPSDSVVMLRVLGGEWEMTLDRTRCAFALGSAAATQVDLHLPFRFVSRLHALIARDQFWITVTNQSTNGISVAGRREDRIAVSPGDTFKVGATELLALDGHMVVLRHALLRQLGLAAHREVDQCLIEIARRDQPALALTGPRGSEMSRLAESIHRSSPRRAFPFVEIDPLTTRAATDLAISRAERGTVFADLRGLKGRKSTQTFHRALFGPQSLVRVMVAASTIAAAHATFEHTVAFAELATPPIASRPGDVLHLLRALMAETGSTRQLAELHADRIAALTSFDWPDNLDDLRKAAQRIAAYLQADGNLRQAAQSLGITDAALGVALERIGAIARRRRSGGE